jgi:hypothetical protein
LSNLRQLVGFSSQRTGFNIRGVHLRIVVNKWKLGQVFLLALPFYLANYQHSSHQPLSFLSGASTAVPFEAFVSLHSYYFKEKG